MEDKDIEKRFLEFVAVGLPNVSAVRHGDAKVVNAIGVLGLAIQKFDSTSSFLSMVNIILAGLLAFFAVLQIWIMLRGVH